ncbi:hypothetical protein M404DRAFT_999346 [Pisolithus tinctorius Marx 270]|uniref:Uncharacterized protein n=1 Tax=Pisolithus tinctorius Marx 270 TaxID=870435 RepID=A0A0C3JAM8_PISTI|nr:hypothetical protein M404DRAFT_999346 [Pisolithus tinctorius Marx 270]
MELRERFAVSETRSINDAVIRRTSARDCPADFSTFGCFSYTYKDAEVSVTLRSADLVPHSWCGVRYHSFKESTHLCRAQSRPV